ncbi:MAG: hypothetical protein OEU91_03190 [Gammaproteobacteria bacterium]|nr:hypothetical protein [Gammaproteobacteria bacterium]
MRTRVLSIVIIATIPLFGAGCSKQVSYNNDVNPILVSNCLTCHVGGEGTEKSGFSVQNYNSLMKGTKFGPVIVPGDSESSTLFRLIGHKADPKIQMPPHHDDAQAGGQLDPLTEEQIETIKMWIDQGAKNN